MKTLFAIFFLFSALYGAEEPPSFDPRLVQQPISEVKLSPPPLFTPHKSSFVAVGLSTLFPGLGHVYLGDAETAARIMGSTSAGISLGILTHNESIGTSSFLTVQNIWSYGIYAAYRDVRAYNGQASYSYKMPTDTFSDLSFAPFNRTILRKPEVWGGLLGAFVIAAGVGSLAYQEEASISLNENESKKKKTFPLLAFPVAIGEESLFRGYLQSQISEATNPWVGIALSSLIFGAAHIPNALALEPKERPSYYKFGVPFITTFGAYFGWLAYKNRSLKEGVALHAWYDFILFAGSFLTKPSAAIRRPGFALSIPF